MDNLGVFMEVYLELMCNDGILFFGLLFIVFCGVFGFVLCVFFFGCVFLFFVGICILSIVDFGEVDG